MSNFFVLGLPRSRTAWLANFLTYDNNFCFHEGLNGCRSIAEYKTKIGDHGDSGTGLALIDLPVAPKIIIERDIEPIIEFVSSTYGYCDRKDIIRLKRRLDKVQGLRIAFNDIDDRLQDIWEYLIGDGFDQQRADMLKKLNIQVNDPFDIDIDAANELRGDLCLGQ